MFRFSLPKVLIVVVVLGAVSALFIINNLLINRAVSKHEQQFNSNQLVQTRLASEALKEAIESIRKDAAVVADFSLKEYAAGDRSKESINNLIQLVRQKTNSLACAFFPSPKTPLMFNAAEGQRGKEALAIAKQWVETYWDKTTVALPFFAPPFHVTPKSQLAGIMHPVSLKDNKIGILISVINLRPPINNYVKPLRSGKYGAGYLLSEDGTIVFDHEEEIIGLNVFGGMHEKYPELLAVDKRLVTEDSGQGEYSFTVKREGRISRKLIAWSSVSLGDRKLVVCLSAPDIEIDAALEETKLFQAASVVLVLILLGSGGFYYSKRETAKKVRKLRNYLSNIINSMPSVLVGVDREGRVTQWNNGAQKATGVPPSEAMGQPLDKVFPGLSSEMERVYEAMRTREVQANPKKPKLEEGVTHYEDVTVFPLVANGVEGAVIRIDDVTSRVRLEDMMVQSEKMMSVGGLAAGMAHEINNPLAAILGYSYNINTRIFSDKKKNIAIAKECSVSLEKIREYLEKRDIRTMLDGIRDSGNRAAKIVTNMLTFSRKGEKKLQPSNLQDLLEDTLELASKDYDLKKRFDFRQIEITRDYAADMPLVPCEGNSMQQVFLNLLKNGAEAMAEKDYQNEAPSFFLGLRVESDFAVIEIKDNGPGLDEKTKMRIFEPFYTSKPVGQGTGLGLSVSYFIITDQHKGHLEVHSHPGKWTCFTIKLPLSIKES